MFSVYLLVTKKKRKKKEREHAINKKSQETFRQNKFRSITDRPTDKVNYIHGIFAKNFSLSYVSAHKNIFP